MFFINNILWHIKFVSPNNRIFQKNNGSFTVGVCDNIAKTIYLANNLEGAMLKKVLCHEIVHAAMFSYRINLSYEQEEVIADLISTYGEEIINITNEVFKRLQ